MFTMYNEINVLMDKVHYEFNGVNIASENTMMDGWMDVWINGWMDKWMDGFKSMKLKIMCEILCFIQYYSIALKSEILYRLKN